MCDILLAGAGPVPRSDTTQTCSYNLRTVRFAHWLAAKEIPYRLVAIDIFNDPADSRETCCHSLVGNYALLPRNSQGKQKLSEIIHAVRPKAILAVSYEVAAMVCEIDHPYPVWADMPGWIMAEAQLKATASQDDSFIDQFSKREKAVLRRADKISVVSHNQRHATLGELALLGRLNRRNLDYPLVHVLPPIAIDWRLLLKDLFMNVGITILHIIPTEWAAMG